MPSYKFASPVVVLFILASSLPFLAGTAVAKTPEPPASPELFARLPDKALAKLPRQAIRGKSHAVKADRKLLQRNNRFSVSLPGDMSIEVIRKQQKDLGKGRSSWVGHASDDPASTIVLGISGDAIAGSFNYRGKLFKLEPRANGSQVLSEVKTTAPAPELDPIAISVPASAADVGSGAPKLSARDNTGANSAASVIDVLIVTTPAVRALYGAEGNEALAVLAIAETNQAYSNSNMATRLNLVGVYQTNYNESGDMGTDLQRLSGTNDGFMDDVHLARNIYGADLVSLIEENGQYCGTAYLMDTLSTSWAPWGFSVVNHSCATGYYSFAHEIGHNQGAHHDIANAGGAATIYPYAHGYQDPNGAFRTVMAYNCPGGCARIQHFANPNVLYGGVPTGEPTYAADALVIDQTAATIATFRATATGAPPGC